MTFHRFVEGVRWLVWVAAAAAAVMLFSLRGGTSETIAPNQLPDNDGAVIYAEHCQICHGASGQGGTGPALSGVIAERFPDPSMQREIILTGGTAMPAFDARLNDEQIDAVVEFTRYGF